MAAETTKKRERTTSSDVSTCCSTTDDDDDDDAGSTHVATAESAHAVAKPTPTESPANNSSTEDSADDGIVLREFLALNDEA